MSQTSPVKSVFFLLRIPSRAQAAFSRHAPSVFSSPEGCLRLSVSPRLPVSENTYLRVADDPESGSPWGLLVTRLKTHFPGRETEAAVYSSLCFSPVGGSAPTRGHLLLTRFLHIATSLPTFCHWHIQFMGDSRGLCPCPFPRQTTTIGSASPDTPSWISLHNDEAHGVFLCHRFLHHSLLAFYCKGKLFLPPVIYWFIHLVLPV